MAERNITTPYARLADNALVRGRDFNRLVQDVIAYFADAGQAVQPEQVQDFADGHKMLVRITGAAQISTSEPVSYSGSEVIQKDDGTIGDRPIPTQFKVGSVGSAFYPLREKSGNPSVPIDGSVIVEVEPSSSGSYMTFDYAAVEYWFELTGSSGAAYAWKRKYPVAGGTLSDLINPYTGVVYSGTTTQNMLREIHGVTGLANGTIVKGYPGGGGGAAQVVIKRQQMGDGAALHEIQTVYIKRAVAGSYVIDGDTLAWNHNAAALQAAVAGTTVTGSGVEGFPWLVEWTDFDPHELLTANTTLLLGDQEWLFDCLYGGNVIFNTLTVGSIISTLFQGVKQARVTVTSLGAGYARSGNVITASANGTLGAQDGITLVVGDRVLLRSGNSDAGLYEVTSLGSGSTKFVLTRTSDADESTEMVSGTLVYVRHGTDGTGFRDTLWRLTTEPPIVLNTDALTFKLLAPQGIRNLTNEYNGRGYVRYIAGTGITLGFVDTPASDQVEVTISATGGSVGLYTYSGGVGVVADPVTRLYTGDGMTAAVLSGSYGLLNVSVAGDQSAGAFPALGGLSNGDQNLKGTKAFGNIATERLFFGRQVSGTTTFDGFSYMVATFNGSPFRDNLDITLTHSTHANRYVKLYLQTRNDGGQPGGMILDASNDSGFSEDFVLQVNGAGGNFIGVWNPNLNGLQVSAGLITGGTPNGASIGQAIGGGPSSGGILFSDGSGNLAQDSGFLFNATTDVLTLGGFLITKATSAPSGIPVGSWAGPYPS